MKQLGILLGLTALALIKTALVGSLWLAVMGAWAGLRAIQTVNLHKQ